MPFVHDLAALAGTAPDVCIVGAGAAGLTLGTELARHGVDVLVLEGGGLDYSHRSQDLYDAAVVGDPYFDPLTARLRYFGGSTGHWAGWTMRLRSMHFRPHPHGLTPGWPIDESALEPYLAPAAERLNVPVPPEDEAVPGCGSLRRTRLVYSTPVARFAETEPAVVERLAALRVALNANVVDLELADGRVHGVVVADYDGNRVTVGARIVVLACGGIEVPRLLRYFNRRYGDALGNEHGLVGAYWMEHPEYDLGLFVQTDFDVPPPDDQDRYSFVASEELIRRRNILDFRGDFKVYEYEGVKAVIADLACLAPNLAERVARSVDSGLRCVGALRLACEQEPRAANRVALADERDRFGVPKAVLHWTRSEADRRTVVTAAQVLAEHAAACDFGRVRLEPWTDDLDFTPPQHGILAGHHHLGGARMGRHPREGVVDPNGRVFNTSNLYVAGSATFPRGGFSNPTFSIVALALRLADHLRHGLRDI
jgi:choline dehydrogenase-like flavoprotein